MILSASGSFFLPAEMQVGAITAMLRIGEEESELAELKTRHPKSFAYSVLNAVIGFTRVARLAGKKQARSVAMASMKLALTSARGSVGST